MQFLLMNQKASSRNQPAAGSRLSSSLPQRLLPADGYLTLYVSYASRTKILRLQLRMTVSGGKSRNAAAIGGYIILIDAHGVDTTTLGPKGPVKL